MLHNYKICCFFCMSRQNTTDNVSEICQQNTVYTSNKFDSLFRDFKNLKHKQRQ